MRKLISSSCAAAIGIFTLAGILAGGDVASAQETANSLGTIHRYDARLDELIPKDAKIEILGSPFLWAEGPVWVKDGGFLLFSDVKRNFVMKWKEGEGVSVFFNDTGNT